MCFLTKIIFFTIYIDEINTNNTNTIITSKLINCWKLCGQEEEGRHIRQINAQIVVLVEYR